MCDGTRRSIEEVEPGDWVWSKDEATGEENCRQVADVKVTLDQPVLDLETEDADGQIEVFGVTAEHPFWVVDHGWTPAGEFAPGDEVYTSQGGWVRVSGATWTSSLETVYNFEVEGFHTYFVGESAAWVHNNCDIPRIDGTGKLHGDIPNHVPESWTRSDLEELQQTLPESIRTREQQMRKLGEEGGHRNRIREERGLLRQVNDRLESLDSNGR